MAWFDREYPRDDEGNSIYEYLEKYTAPVKKAEREIVGRELEKSRVMAAMNRPELCNVMLLAEAGSGKALINETFIPCVCADGYKMIKDLVSGDMVFDEAGRPVKVLGVYPQGLKRAYRVTFSDGSTIICNDEHLWASRSRWQHNNRYDFEVRTLREMMDKGIIHHRGGQRPQELKNWYVPRNMAVQRDPVDLPVHPYVVGALLGDGCLTSRYSLDISSDDVFVVDRVSGLIGAVGYQRRKNGYTWSFHVDPAKISSPTNKYIKRVDVLGDTMFTCMEGVHSIDRRIPRPYMTGSVEQRMELLRGLMDTDGTATGSEGRINVSFATNSKGLAEDVMELAASLGMRTTFRSEERRDDIHVNIEYGVYFMVDEDMAMDLFHLPRQRDWIAEHRRHDKWFNRHYDDIAIADVEDLGEDVEMTCIYVDGPSHLFQAGKSHIVTHNTALVQGLMLEDNERYYLEVDLAHMIADLTDKNQMADRLKQLFDEVARYCKAEDCQLVLFIDEFHQVVELSPAAVEVLKPLLADSGTRGIRVIAATTFVEFRKWISPNQPLVERLQRINLEAPDKKMVVSILRGMARRYGVDNQFYDNRLFEEIYDLTNRYIPANAQPRKSILVLDAMVGWHRYNNRPMDRRLLADVIYESEGVNIAFRVDAARIKQNLDEHVFAQELASTIIQDRLQICVADLNDKSKPMSSFLFTGSTGVGKMLADDTPVPVWSESGVRWKRHGDLVPGDMVFNRLGRPVPVTGFFPQGEKAVYEVTLSDGRVLRAGDGHLWNYRCRAGDVAWKTGTTKDLMDRLRTGARVAIPMNGVVGWPESEVGLDPYVAGVILACGHYSPSGGLVLGCQEEFPVAEAGMALGVGPERYGAGAWLLNYDKSRFDLEDFGLGCHKGSCGRKVPDAYKTGSVAQRWALVQGVFDTRGRLDASGGRCGLSVCSASGQFIRDMQEILFSLGLQGSISTRMNRHKLFWVLHVQCGRDKKVMFFRDEVRLSAVKYALAHMKEAWRDRRSADQVLVKSIRRTREKVPMSCIMVDDPEHLYQAGQFVVTHNTEMTKTLAEILFNDSRKLIRFDMTEFALESSLDTFRRELTSRVWERPYSIILLDEIEKACAPVTRILLQVLDDGRLTDENNREVPFVNAYIILTTNAGSEIYKDIAQYHESDTGAGEDIEKYQKLIRNSIVSTTGANKFPPELLGRIDCIVPFQPLSEETQRRIVTSKLKKLQKMVEEKHGIKLRIKQRIVEYLVKDNLDTDSDAGGARAVISKLESEVTTAVARAINMFSDAEALQVDYEGEPAYLNKNKLESSAHIVVKPTGLGGRAGFADMR